MCTDNVININAGNLPIKKATILPSLARKCIPLRLHVVITAYCSVSDGRYLVLSEAALLLLLVVDSESELERGRRGSFLYTRKLSVTGWFPPSKPLLGKPRGTRVPG